MKLANQVLSGLDEAFFDASDFKNLKTFQKAIISEYDNSYGEDAFDDNFEDEFPDEKEEWLDTFKSYRKNLIKALKKIKVINFSSKDIPTLWLEGSDAWNEDPGAPWEYIDDLISGLNKIVKRGIKNETSKSSFKSYRYIRSKEKN